MTTLTLRLIDDSADRRELDDVFESYWPAYRRWMSRAAPLAADACVVSLRAHMPELLPVLESLLDRFGDRPEVVRFLTLVNPPRVVRACTQLVIESDRGPALVRTYDHHPKLFDGIVLRSAWRTKTVAMSDCVWGALDGINEHGLAIALAFGGRNAIGDGFSAPLICRYVLETCASVGQARAVLERVPVYMPYTFVVAERSGAFTTAYLGPDRDAAFVEARASANHQGRVDWPEYARFSETRVRERRARALAKPDADVHEVLGSFCSEPLWRTRYAQASGTLYACAYVLAEGSLELAWPGRRERIAFDDPFDRALSVDLDACMSR